MKRRKIAITVIALLVVVLTALWGVMAIWYQGPASESLRVACSGLWALCALGVLGASLRNRKPWLLAAYALASVE